MPPSTMMETAPPNDEPRKKADHSLRIDESTKKRLTQKSLERKKHDSSSQRESRKSVLSESMDKWADSQESGRPVVKKKKATNGISEQSDHGQPKLKKDLLSRSDHSKPVKKKHVPEKRYSTPGDNDGKLGAMLDSLSATEPRKKGGPRTVASMPVTRSEEHGRRKSISDDSRGRSPGPIKKHYPGTQTPMKKPVKKHYPRSQSPGEKHYPRSQSPAAKRDESPYRPVQKQYVSPANRVSADSSTPIKKRTASPAPVKKRPASTGPVKKRSASLGPVKKYPSTRSATTRKPTPVSQPEDSNNGKLGMMLDNMDAGQPRKKGPRSVASAPANSAHRKDRDSESRENRSTRGEHTSGKKSKSSSSKGMKDGGSPRRMRRTKSADDVDLGTLEEHLANIDSADPPESRTHDKSHRSKKSTKPVRSERSEDASSTTQGESGSIDDGRPQLSKRSSSVGPRVNTPSAPKEDRRAEMKRHKSMQNGSEHQAEEPRRMPRAQSMMLHREATRRGGKSSSLADLVQYSEEEIHSTSYFASNHVLVNRERMKRGLRPLTRNIAMDELARENAKAMAETAGVAPIKATYVGNVLRGESIRAIHRSTMQQKQGRERANLLNPYFQDFGVGTAKGKDGMLYMCQLFSERLELTCSDTASAPAPS